MSRLKFSKNWENMNSRIIKFDVIVIYVIIYVYSFKNKNSKYKLFLSIYWIFLKIDYEFDYKI